MHAHHRNDGRRRGRVHALAGAALAAGLALATAGCASLGSSTDVSDAKATATAPGAVAHSSPGATGGESGCTAALDAVSRYGPSTVKLLADGREAVTHAAVSLLVDALDSAADAADTPQSKQAIRTLARAYDDYFNLTTDAVSIPLSTLLKDTADFEFVCH